MSHLSIPTPEAPVFERGLWNRGWFMALLCAVFVAVDWELVPLAVFPFVFVFPVMLVAWNRGPGFALAACAVLALTRVMRDYSFDVNLTVDELAGAAVRFFVLALLAVLTVLLSRQSRLLRRRVQQLEGVLPICAGCKSIREADGSWVPLEGYLMTHSGAQFSHGFCPVCFKAYYGDMPPARPADNK